MKAQAMRALLLVLLAPLLLGGCLAGAVVGATGAVVGAAVRTTGAVVGAGVDAVTPGDDDDEDDEEDQEDRD